MLFVGLTTAFALQSRGETAPARPVAFPDSTRSPSVLWQR